jgi:hypothetical protein
MKNQVNEQDDGKKKKPKLILRETLHAMRFHSWGYENIHGEILRETDEEGRLVSVGAKIMLEFEKDYVWSRDKDIEKLTENLETLLWLRNECRLHRKFPAYSHVAEMPFYLN